MHAYAYEEEDACIITPNRTCMLIHMHMLMRRRMHAYAYEEEDAYIIAPNRTSMHMLMRRRIMRHAS
jgi:hypothetical protein